MLTGVRSKRRGGREAYSFHDQLLSTAVHPYCGCRSLNAATQRYSLCVSSYKVLGLVARPHEDKGLVISEYLSWLGVLVVAVFCSRLCLQTCKKFRTETLGLKL